MHIQHYLIEEKGALLECAVVGIVFRTHPDGSMLKSRGQLHEMVEKRRTYIHPQRFRPLKCLPIPIPNRNRSGFERAGPVDRGRRVADGFHVLDCNDNESVNHGMTPKCRPHL